MGRCVSFMGRRVSSVCMILLMVSGVAIAAVKPATVRIPRVPSAPAIDGVINDDEWTQAAMLTGGVWETGERGVLTSRQFAALLGWDAENLYLAVRSLHAPGAKLSFTNDSTCDAVELGFFPLKTQDLALRVREPFRIILSRGRMFECDLQKPWEPAIESASRVFTDAAGMIVWELEARFSIESFDIPDANQAGDGWRLLISRNFTEPREQSHLPVGRGFFSPRGWVQAVLTSGEPTAGMCSVMPLLLGKTSVDLRLNNTLPTPAKFTIETAILNVSERNRSLYQSVQNIEALAGQTILLSGGGELEGLKPNQVAEIHLSVKGEDDTVYLAYQARYRVDPELMERMRQTSRAEGPGARVRIDSPKEIQAMAQQIAKSLLKTPAIAEAETPPVIAFAEVRNMSHIPMNTDMYVRQARTHLMQEAGGKFIVLDRRTSFEVLDAPKQQMEAGDAQATVIGADYFLTGTIDTIQHTAGAKRTTNIRHVFRLTDAETAQIVWEEAYEVTAETKPEGWYR